MCGATIARGSAVEQRGHVVGRLALAADLDERAYEDAHHVLKERRAVHFDRDEILALQRLHAVELDVPHVATGSLLSRRVVLRSRRSGNAQDEHSDQGHSTDHYWIGGKYRRGASQEVDPGAPPVTPS